MRKLPESSHFAEEMSNATSFRQRHLKEASIELNQMIQNGSSVYLIKLVRMVALMGLEGMVLPIV